MLCCYSSYTKGFLGFIIYRDDDFEVDDDEEEEDEVLSKVIYVFIYSVEPF